MNHVSLNTVVEVHKLHKSYANQRVVDDLSLNISARVLRPAWPNGAARPHPAFAAGLTAAGWRHGETARPCRAHPCARGASEAWRGAADRQPRPRFYRGRKLLVYGRYFGMSDAEINARIPMLLEFSNLTAKRDAMVPTLSGGMKRRLSLARAL